MLCGWLVGWLLFSLLVVWSVGSLVRWLARLLDLLGLLDLIGFLVGLLFLLCLLALLGLLNTWLALL